MNANERKYINDIADRIRSVFDISVPIDDLNDVVEKLGGVIKETSGFNDSYDGTIKKTGEYSFEIAISPYQTSKRKNFTVAHELGHLFLHMGFLIDNTLWNEQDEKVYTRFGSSEKEYQANEFAAAFLMPKDEYGSYLNQIANNNRVQIQDIADHFNVSLLAAKNRGVFLGYFQ